MPSATVPGPSELSTDAELCELVRRGDGYAADVLVRRHMALVRSVVTKLGRIPSAVDVDDLLQAGRLALWRAARFWRPGRGTRFTTWAWPIVGRAVRAELGRQLDAPRAVDPTGRDDEDLNRVRLDTIPARESAEVPDLVPLLAGLSLLQRLLVTAYYGLDGRVEGTADRPYEFPWSRVAAELGVSVPQVRRLLDDALLALRDRHDAGVLVGSAAG